MIAAILLALQLDPAKICAKYESYTPPAANAEVVKCGDPQQFCFAVLAEKYANGDGVTRDLDAAEYFLCKAAGEMADDEHEGMLEHLQKMRAGETAEPLAYCDHVASGYDSTYCAHVQYDRDMRKLDERLGRIHRNSKLNALKQRMEAYMRAESDRVIHVFRGGTAYTRIMLASDVDEKTRSIEMLERFSSSRASAATAAQLKKADAALNKAYREVMNVTTDDEEDDDIDPKTLLRDAQRAWIAWRDAFADYYVERWRGAAAPDALRREIVTELTGERTYELLDPETKWN